MLRIQGRLFPLKNGLPQQRTQGTPLEKKTGRRFGIKEIIRTFAITKWRRKETYCC
jgi:hypothetical protein